MSIPYPAPARAAAALSALAFAALMGGCTDPVSARPLLVAPGERPAPAPAATCEELGDAARSYALLRGLYEYCYTPTLPPVVWDPFVPRPDDPRDCTCRARNDR